MLKFRILTGTTLIVVFGVLSFWNSTISPILFLAFASFFLCVAMMEFFSLTQELGFRGYPILTCTIAVSQYIGIGALTFFRAFTDYGAVLESILMLSFIILLFIRVFRESDLSKGIKNFIVSLGGFVYLYWSMSFMLKIYFLHREGTNTGPLLLFFVVTVTKCADIGGYTLGKLTAVRLKGNHKLVPRLSPQKSWEGLLGSFIFSIGIACLLVTLIGDKVNACGIPLLTFTNAVILAILFSLLGLMGDLSVSALKRAAKQKDSGAVVPGFGGTLDLVDSLLLVSPFYYCLLKLYKV